MILICRGLCLDLYSVAEGVECFRSPGGESAVGSHAACLTCTPAKGADSEHATVRRRMESAPSLKDEVRTSSSPTPSPPRIADKILDGEKISTTIDTTHL